MKTLLLLSLSKGATIAISIVLGVIILIAIAAIVYFVLKRRGVVRCRVKMATAHTLRTKPIIHSNRKSPKNALVDTGIYILLAIISIIWVFPFVYLIFSSLRGESHGIVEYMIPKQFTLDNYVWLFSGTSSQYPFLRWYLNTLLVSLVVSVINTMITLLTAYALSRMRFNGRKSLMKFMLILGMFPGFLGMICIYYLLGPDALGLIGNGAPFPIAGLMLVYISGTMMGYYVSKGFFDTISRSLDEAAMIDGASRAKIFFSIILPLSKPIIIQTLLGAFTGPWGDYMMANYILRGDVNSKTVAIGMNSMIDTFQNRQENFTRFCAGGVVVSILPLVMFFFMQRYYVAGVTGGSVKG